MPEIEAGLNIPAFLEPSINAAAAAGRGLLAGLEVWTLDRFAFKRKDLNGFLLGFAAFHERELRAAVVILSRSLVH